MSGSSTRFVPSFLAPSKVDNFTHYHFIPKKIRTHLKRSEFIRIVTKKFNYFLAASQVAFLTKAVKLRPSAVFALKA